MKVLLFISALLLACASAQYTKSSTTLTIEQSILRVYEDKPVKELFKVFHYIFNKPYDLNSETALIKYRIFKENVKANKEHNAKNLSWWNGVNQFTDMTDQEFNEMYNKSVVTESKTKGNSGNLKTSKFLFELEDDDDTPDPPSVNSTLNLNPTQANIDWSAYLSPVRDQGNCGGCWAFSTGGVIESRVNINNNGGQIPWVSTQQMIDCGKPYGLGGCGGGSIHLGLEYAASGGLMHDSDYPFTQKTGPTCNFVSSKVALKPKSYGSSVGCSLTTYLNLLGVGPLAVAMDAGVALKNYGGGIIDLDATGKSCSSANHAVLAYGYSTDSNGRGIVHVRNSWTGNWGDKGNFHIYYTTDNHSTCYLSNGVYYPTF